MNNIHIRRAVIDDVEACLAIYNYEVEHGVATLDLEPRSLDEWRQWFYEHGDEHHPIFVGIKDAVVVGYASLSSFRDKEAYKSTVELSVYIHQDYRGRGVASKLMEAILQYARDDDVLHNVVSVITAGNEASVKLHERCGFTYCGRMPQVGFKKGAYQDIEMYVLLV